MTSELSQRMRLFLTGERASVVQVDRLARFLCLSESGDWTHEITAYRDRAKRILTTSDGWKNENH